MHGGTVPSGKVQVEPDLVLRSCRVSFSHMSRHVLSGGTVHTATRRHAGAVLGMSEGVSGGAMLADGGTASLTTELSHSNSIYFC